MNKQQAKARIAKLKKVINHHRYLYHVLDTQEISDAALDSLKNELAELERQFPDLVTPDSPTQRVGGEALDVFEKAEHATPMLSIADVFTDEKLKDWEVYLRKISPRAKLSFFCEMKMDGFAVSLLYKNGLLERAATRGNGSVGENVTENIKTIESIPLRLELHETTKAGTAPAMAEKRGQSLLRAVNHGTIEVRGEVYMDKKTFLEINRKQKRKGEKEYANPRNLAAGSVRQLDPKVTASRKLKFMAYDIVGDFGQTRHSEEHAMAKALGFKTDPFAKQCKNIEEAILFWKKIEKKRKNLPYAIDGIVVLVDDNADFAKFGVAGKGHRGMRAFKFAPEQATTRVLDITVHVGRQGAVTPVAHLEPVNIAGVTVSRATLHNQDEIRRLDVRVGDTVIVERAGDVIPDIIEVVKDLRTGREKKFVMPTDCPVCGHALKKTEEVAFRCVHTACPARSREYLYFFVSKKAFDIDGLGPKILDQLQENNLVAGPEDIFDLQEGDLVPLERFAEKSAKNIIRAIQNSKKIPFARFLHALGIRHVGEETAIDLARYFGNIENLMNARPQDIKGIPGIGDVVAREIHKWFNTKAHRAFLKRLFKRGVLVEKPKKAGEKLKGTTFVFTGALSGTTRQWAEKRVRMLGGDPTSSVSRNTDYVVVGENPGSKYKAAKKMGVKIINEKEFLKMLG